MRQLFQDLLFYENLLLAYYADEQKVMHTLLNDNINVVMKHFFQIFETEDELKGTNHINLIREIYSNSKFENRTDYFKRLHICNSTFQRYREKYCSTLKLIIERLNTYIS